MLKSIGVDSIKELRHRNPAHLKEMIEERHGPVVGLSEHETQTWIEEAKAFQEEYLRHPGVARPTGRATPDACRAAERFANTDRGLSPPPSRVGSAGRRPALNERDGH